jgi:hypothetical protein
MPTIELVTVWPWTAVNATIKRHKRTAALLIDMNYPLSKLLAARDHSVEIATARLSLSSVQGT